MRNKIKDISIKTTHAIFSMILSIQKFLIQLILKSMQDHAKIFSFTTLNMWRSKIQSA